MANGYNPRQFMTSLSNIAQQSGAQGLRWMGQQKGLGRQSIRNYLNMMANAASTASSQLGIGNLLATGAGLVATAAGGPIFGGLVAGGVSKFTGDRAVSGLAQDAAGFDMDSILYGRDKAEEAMSTATGAVDKLIDSVDAQALSKAITTPLMYMTLQNTFGAKPTGGIMPGGVESSLGAYSPEITKQMSMIGAPTGPGTQYYSTAKKLGETGGLTSPVDVYGGSNNSLINFLFGRR